LRRAVTLEICSMLNLNLQTYGDQWKIFVFILKFLADKCCILFLNNLGFLVAMSKFIKISNWWFVFAIKSFWMIYKY
jgi:hypothetical protein